MDSSAGASARHEAERRSSARQDKIRKRHPRLGGLILALTDDPQTTKNWNVGAAAEEKVGSLMRGLDGIAVLHDRIEPGRSRANIDHIVITPTGVIVVDTKKYKGMIDVSRSRLKVAGRDKTALVTSVERQAASLRPLLDGVSVASHLCFVSGDIALTSLVRCHNTHITGTRGLRRRIKKMTAGAPSIDVAAVAARLDARLRPA
jgi:hypothetical protein